MKKTKNEQSFALLSLSGFYHANLKQGMIVCFLIFIVLTNVYSQNIHRVVYEGDFEKFHIQKYEEDV